MAPLLEDPRFRQTWNQFSQNAEEATETAAAGIWTFQHRYITPCFSSIGACFESCSASCFPDRDERARRLRDRSRTRGRAELSFDFYDDWDEDERTGGAGGILGWGNDELDRLLAGSGSHGGEGTSQPRRKRGMSYGTRAGKGRKKSLENDPTIIPSTNTLGFLGRLPFKLGGTLRYKPSAADLQEHPGRHDHPEEDEAEPLIPEDESEEDRDWTKGHRRQRSSTASSGETSDSFRSRGDLFPSDGEDDAVPLDDEFAMVLERRMTGDGSSGKIKVSKGKRPAASRKASRTMSRTHSATQRPKVDMRQSSSATSLPQISDSTTPDTPSIAELQLEEQRIREEEDGEIERKREAAGRLAIERGLSLEPEESGAQQEVPVGEIKENTEYSTYQQQREVEVIVPDEIDTDREAGSAEQAHINSDDEAIGEERPSSPQFVAAMLPNWRT